MAYKVGGDANTPEWQAKLADLEYAKEYSLDPTEGSKDPKTVRAHQTHIVPVGN